MESYQRIGWELEWQASTNQETKVAHLTTDLCPSHASAARCLRTPFWATCPSFWQKKMTSSLPINTDSGKGVPVKPSLWKPLMIGLATSTSSTKLTRSSLISARHLTRCHIESYVHKLKFYGIQGSTINWIHGFLTGRSQTVSVNGASSPSTDVISGVPPGIGPWSGLVSCVHQWHMWRRIIINTTLCWWLCLVPQYPHKRWPHSLTAGSFHTGRMGRPLGYVIQCEEMCPHVHLFEAASLDLWLQHQWESSSQSYFL